MSPCYRPRSMSEGSATIGSCRMKARSCTRTPIPSTRRSSNATTRVCGAAPSSSAAAWCWRPATRPRRTACARRWATSRRSACARTRSSSRRAWRRTARRARRCSRCSTTRRRSSRGCRSTRRSWRSAGFGRSRERPRRSRCACGERSARRWACRSPWAWPGRSSSPRWRAGSRSRTVCWSSRSTASWSSCTRCRSSVCGEWDR